MLYMTEKTFSIFFPGMQPFAGFSLVGDGIMTDKTLVGQLISFGAMAFHAVIDAFQKGVCAMKIAR